MIESPKESSEINLRIATETISWDGIVYAFTEVSGKKVVFKDIKLDEYFASCDFSDPCMKVRHSERGRGRKVKRSSTEDGEINEHLNGSTTYQTMMYCTPKTQHILLLEAQISRRRGAKL